MGCCLIGKDLQLSGVQVSSRGFLASLDESSSCSRFGMLILSETAGPRKTPATRKSQRGRRPGYYIFLPLCTDTIPFGLPVRHSGSALVLSAVSGSLPDSMAFTNAAYNPEHCPGTLYTSTCADRSLHPTSSLTVAAQVNTTSLTRCWSTTARAAHSWSWAAAQASTLHMLLL